MLIAELEKLAERPIHDREVRIAPGLQLGLHRHLATLEAAVVSSSITQ